MLIIGEKINSSIPSVSEAIGNMDKAQIQKLARDQVSAGAGVIDVNAGTFRGREQELLPWLVETVQEMVDVPLCIDSPDPAALAAGLAVARKKVIINSISAEKDRYRQVLPLVQQYASSVIALCMDDRGIPSSAADRLQIAQLLTDRLRSDGIMTEDIYLDIMVQPIGTKNDSGRIALDTVRTIKEKIPGVHITCGLSNVSYGLPKRRLLNQAFAVALAASGMDVMFLDPLDEKMMSLLCAINALMGCDEYCCDYLVAYRAGKLG